MVGFRSEMVGLASLAFGSAQRIPTLQMVGLASRNEVSA